jgi:hypothetical protein
VIDALVTSANWCRDHADELLYVPSIEHKEGYRRAMVNCEAKLRRFAEHLPTAYKKPEPT